MPVKERLSRVSLYTLVPLKPFSPKVTLQEDSLASKPFITPKRKTEHKFTGRRRELDYLRTLYSEVLLRLKKQNAGKEISHKPIIAAIRGEAGIGKSRLSKEFITRIKNNSGIKSENVFYGYALSSGQNSYGLFSSMIKPADEKNRSIAQNAIKEFIFKKAAGVNKEGAPLIIMLEDMQWADEPSLAALEHIVRSVNLYTDTGQPQIFFILNSRVKFKPSKVLRAECDYREITLTGFSEAESCELITRIAGKGLKPKARELIERRSDGSPFNIEEWCSLLLENKSFAKVPDSVKDLLVDKVLELSSDERAVIITASVLGRKFELKVLNLILKRLEKNNGSQEVIKQLIEKRYLVNLTGDVYEFRHDILHETIYSRLTATVKQNVHLLAGNAIEELFAGRLSEHYYELARHYTSAKSASKSVEYLEKAGDKAKDNYEHNRALGYYEKLLKLAEKEKTYGIIFKMCDVYMNRSEWNKQIELCRNILAESLRLDKNIKAECYKRIGHALRLKGDYKDALKIYKKGYRIYEERHNVQGKLDIMEHEAKVMMNMGKYKEALSSFKGIYKISKENGYGEPYKNALSGLGITSSKIGDYDNTIKFNNELLKYSLKRIDRQGIVTSKINKAEALYCLGRYNDSYLLYKESLNIANKISNIRDSAVCLGNIGILYWEQNNFIYANKLFRKQLEKFKLIGDISGIARSLGLIGASYISLRFYRQAMKYLSQQLNLYKKLKKKQAESLCIGNIGLVYYNLGNFEEAKKHYIKQLRIDKKFSNIDGIFRAMVNLGILYRSLNNLKKAKLFLSKALKFANDKNIKNNFALPVIELAEINFEQKKYLAAQTLVEEYLNDKTKNSYSFLNLRVKILIEKIHIFKSILNGNSKIDECYIYLVKIIRCLSEYNSYEQQAFIYYEAWKLLKILASFKISIETKLENKYRKQSLNLYKKLNYPDKQFEFEAKINELMLTK